MSDDEASLSMSIPLDADGFLRRECPTCEREFKWLPAEDDTEFDEMSDGGYFCPYCAIQAPPESWFTQAQIEFAESLITTEVVGPMVKKFSRDLSRIGRNSGGLVSVSASYDIPGLMVPLTEADDMKRVDFSCHATEPVKVLDDWNRPIYCLICGNSAS